MAQHNQSVNEPENEAAQSYEKRNAVRRQKERKDEQDAIDALRNAIERHDDDPQQC